VNAYYSPPNNDINFPAGILQPPFFDKDADDAVNFGGIGVVIGHELTHGFDDQGSKFDAEGNLTNWWTQANRDEFDKRTTCIADEYSSFVAVDDIHLNGRLTLGENTADNGGLRIALAALHADMEKDPKAAATKDGFTPEQRFFIGFAQVWCQNGTPESSRLLAKTDPHSPGEYRTNGTLQKLVIADLITGTSDSQTCNYLYDDLVRLSSGGCGTFWTQNFTYDAFGNIQKSVPSGDGGGSFLPIYSTANPNNQFTSIPGVTAPYYDQNGNVVPVGAGTTDPAIIVTIKTVKINLSLLTNQRDPATSNFLRTSMSASARLNY